MRKIPQILETLDAIAAGGPNQYGQTWCQEIANTLGNNPLIDH